MIYIFLLQIKKATSNEENTQGVLLLFLTILHHKSQLKLEENFCMKIWNAVKNINVSEQDEEDYAQLIVLIYEHISNEEFSTAVKDLIDFAVSKNNDNQKTNLKRQF